MKNADLKEKLELAVKKFQEELENDIEEQLKEAVNDVVHEIEYRTDYFLSELLIELGLKKRPKMTITEKQMKEVLDEFCTPAILEQIRGPSPLFAHMEKLKKKGKK